MKQTEPSSQSNARYPNTNTRNIAPATAAPHFVGPPCNESGCRCEGWSDESGSGACDNVNPVTGKPCGHSVEMHYEE